MESILDRYGIKEVADVTFYEINSDGTPGKPVLYLDTLKVSTIEQTAELAEAKGGKGNSSLIAWDFGKEITLNIEDALFSPKSLATMFGNGNVDSTQTSMLFTQVATVVSAGTAPVLKYTNSSGSSVAVSAATIEWHTEAGASVSASALTLGQKIFGTYTLTATSSRTITISADSFPGTYYVVGDTSCRPDSGAKDLFFRFIVPKAKLQSENTITLEAEGDPSTFNMSLKVLRPADKVMMKLQQYDL
jgi:hypothetical protein